MPSGSSSAARAPFVLLVVLLLGGGLITLLLLNSSLNEGSFKLSKLKKQTTDLTDEQQALQRDVDDHSAPGALAKRARELGMVPGGNPAFLQPNGTVRGRPSQADALRPPPVPAAPAAPASGPDTIPGPPTGTPSTGARIAPVGPPGVVPSTPTALMSGGIPVPAAGGPASPTTSPGR
jgi:hypothetical protein